VQARAFKKRWKMVNAAEMEDLRSTPVSEKFQKLSSLLLSAKHFHRPKNLAREESEIWERWNRIRRAFRV
jgi:hypothetical protein